MENETVGTVSFFWLLGLLVLQRLADLLLCRRNRAALLARGGREAYPGSYRAMVSLHVLFLGSLAAESYPWRLPLDALTVGCLAAYLLLEAARYWCIATLGVFWNTRIVVLPGAKIVRSGPYRLVRHPNYLVLVLEFLVLPLLFRAWFTLAFFSAANLLVLRLRIRLEERALREATDFGEASAGS